MLVTEPADKRSVLHSGDYSDQATVNMFGLHRPLANHCFGKLSPWELETNKLSMAKEMKKAVEDILICSLVERMGHITKTMQEM